MTVNIRGKEYVTVAERVAAFHEDHSGTEGFYIQTAIFCEDEEQITVKATVLTKFGTFQGHARSTKKASGIEGQSPLEVAETSAVGRALGFAGYGSVESIASADEVKANGHLVQAAKAAGARPTSPPAGPIPVCPEHKAVTGGRDNPHCPKCDWRPNA